MLLLSAQSVVRHTLLVAGLLTLAACSETIVLGTECPERLGACDGRARAEDSGQALDASVPDAQLDSAADAELPSQDGGELARIANGSFELGSNPTFGEPDMQYGSDVFFSNVGGAIPIAGGAFANLEPWFACLPASAKAVRELHGVPALDGTGFVYTGGLLGNVSPGVHQRLATPLQPGRSYSFLIDVLSAGGVNNVSLQLGASSQPCAGVRESVSTPAVHDGPWQTHCLTLTPSESLALIDLVPINLGTVGELAFDNLRSVRGCP